jgi:hypothetical protein
MFTIDGSRTAAGSPGLLASTGILFRLRAACLLLASTDPELIRNMMISVSSEGIQSGADEAISRLAEEHCVTARIERRGGALIVRLERRTHDTDSPMVEED